MKNAQSLPVNWFDLVVLVVLIVGLVRGRKRGMSEELLDSIQWLLIVFGAGKMYEPSGLFLAQFTGLPRLYAYILAYVFCAVVVKLLFLLVKRMAGEKLVGSDLFGRLEYYLGMIAGMVRFSCMLFVGLAVLNATLITDAEYEKQVKEDQALYGDTFFPSLGSIQRDVFRNSFTGPHLKEHLDPFLIKETRSMDVMRAREGFGKKREREVDDLMDGSKRKK